MMFRSIDAKYLLCRLAQEVNVSTHMPRYSRATLKRTAEFGIDMASKLTGVPEHTLRLHIDQKRVMGVRKTPSGRRLISREGLASYLRAHGYDEEALSRIERRGAERIVRARPKPVRLEIVGAGPGAGEGVLADLSETGFQVKDLSWTGCLPGPESAVRFWITGGELKGVEGEARVSWISLKDGALSLGFEATPLQASKARWVAFIQKGVETKRREARQAARGAKSLLAAESN